MNLDEAREVFESMTTPGDGMFNKRGWDADIQKLMDTVNSHVAAEREECAKLAEWGAGQCLQHARHPTTHCDEPECSEQRSMAKACENVASEIRARGKA